MSFSSLRDRRLPFSKGISVVVLPLAVVLSAQAAPTAAAVRFPTAKTVLWLGHTQVIPLRLKTATDGPTTFPTVIADPALVEIVRAPVFLSGEQTAYVRVRALRSGQTKLQIFGGPTLDLDVKPDPAQAVDALIDQESRQPEIISPMPGAAVWGEFNVGVSLFDDAPVASGNSAPAAETAAAAAMPGADADRKVQLRLPDGRLLDPINVTAVSFGPERQYQFTVPADVPAGALSLVAVASPKPVADPVVPPGKPVESRPLIVQVTKPPAENLWAGECESPDVLGDTRYLYAPARPANLGIEQPTVAKDPNASGQAFVHGLNRGWCLPFIAKKAGDYQLILRSRGQFGGGAYPTMALYVNYAEEAQGLVRVVGSKYGRVPVGQPVYLDAGPQILTVQFKNGFGGGKENRDLMLDRYEIAWVDGGPPTSVTPANPGRIAATAQAHPAMPGLAGSLHNQPPVAPLPELTGAAIPQLNVLYPANGAGVFGADAVVVQPAGDTSTIDQVDVLLDGQLQHVALRPASASGGLLTFPLLLRGVPPGEHRLAVRATLASGQIVDSPARLLTVLPQALAIRGPYDRAVWLLDRLAFGAEPQELGAVLSQGERKWLAGMLFTSFNDSTADRAVLAKACAQYKHVDSSEQTAARVLDQWIETDNPVRARFTSWVENHFSTWMNKTKPAPQWDEHLAFCRLGVAPFSDLLEASAHSAAMLVYLDQEKSYAGKINENYAREIMELHTLGVHGGYKQGDVTELAQVLTGWTTDEEAALPPADPALRLASDDHGNQAGITRSFRFVPALNDGKARRVFGLQFSAADPLARYDRIQLALEMLAAHPSTADHVCRKLAEQYVGVPAPDALVERLAAKFLESGGDMRAVLFALVQDPDFWNAPPKVATPFDYGMRIARLCRADALQAHLVEGLPAQPELIESFLKRSGMGLFDRVTPDGYPENSDAYADSNALLQRWRFMQSRTPALKTLVPLAWRTPPPPPRPEDTNLNHVPAPVVDPTQRFIDLAAIRLTGRLLSPGSNQAALDVAGQGVPLDLEQALLFVSLLPETSLR
jgi:uncharacterized protein (DUF1800 family)